MLLGMAVLLFGVVGMQMFGGVMRQRCYNLDDGLLLDDTQVTRPRLDVGLARERERERQRQTDRQRDRQTDTPRTPQHSANFPASLLPHYWT